MTGIYGKIPQANFCPELLKLVKKEKVYPLSFINTCPPKSPSGIPSLDLTLVHRHKLYNLHVHKQPTSNTVFTEANESIIMSPHSLTHLDALCHIGKTENYEAEINEALGIE
jgi:hypothetical protein